jgi:hypothetical protein
MQDLHRSGPSTVVVALAAAAALAVGALTAAVSVSPSPASADDGSVLSYEGAGHRYTYHLVTGDESLYDVAADPRELRDLSRCRPELTRELRRALEARLHVDSIESLRAGKSDTIRRLRSLGYL